VESLLPLVQLKHKEEFTWEYNSEKLSRRSKNTSCLHLCCEHPFKMYIVVQEWVIGAVLLQEEGGK
jgi:hypothetical protein